MKVSEFYFQGKFYLESRIANCGQLYCDFTSQNMKEREAKKELKLYLVILLVFFFTASEFPEGILKVPWVTGDCKVSLPSEMQ